MIYLFDIDGTLTDARQKINVEFAELFKSFCSKNQVYLVTGSDIDKVYEQLGVDIVDLHVKGVFSSMANVLHVNGVRIYSNEMLVPPNLIDDLNRVLSKYHLPKTGNHIEYRSGMINFSLIGRNATQQQREDYAKDKGCQTIRKNVVRYLKGLYEQEGLDFFVGGQISIDIQPKGKDKKQSVDWLVERHLNPDITFFGDKTFEGGNDHTVAKEVLKVGGKVHQVENWTETEKILKCL
jgi:phosphomannomutase